MSVGIFFNLDNAQKRKRENAHCKKQKKPFFHMTKCLSFIQDTYLYSVLHMSQNKCTMTIVKHWGTLHCVQTILGQ